MRFRNKVTREEVDASQFKASDPPPAVRMKEFRTYYVVNAQGQEMHVVEGDWIVLDPPGDGTRAHPVPNDVFRRDWELVTF